MTTKNIKAIIDNKEQEIITFSCEIIDSADTIKAVNKHKLAAKCNMAKIEMMEAQQVFNEKVSKYYNLTRELDNMEA